MNSGRLLIVLFFFGAAGCVCGVRAAMLAGPRRAQILSEADKIARQYRKIPGRRGSICDKNGTVLVWSEHYYDLCLRDDYPAPLDAEERAQLQQILPDIRFDAPGKRLRSDLKAGELEALSPLLSGSAPVEVRVRYERVMIGSAAVRRFAGTTEQSRSGLCGTSGWELQYELQLRGIPGNYSVMLDRYQRMIPKTFQLHSSPQAGKDIRLPETLEEIERRAKELP